jgi:hypothetical protein
MEGEVNRDAISVPEYSFCFSDNQPMGTHSLCNCMGVVLRNPKNNRTLLFHLNVDRSNAPTTEHLSLIRSSEDESVDVYAIGAGTNAFSMRWISEYQTQKLFHFLFSNPNLHVLGWQIGQEGTRAENLVVAPLTGNIKKEIPFQKDLQGRIRNGLGSLGLHSDLWRIDEGFQGRIFGEISHWYSTVDKTNLYKIMLKYGEVTSIDSLAFVSRYRDVSVALTAALERTQLKHGFKTMKATLQYVDRKGLEVFQGARKIKTPDNRVNMHCSPLFSPHLGYI